MDVAVPVNLGVKTKESEKWKKLPGTYLKADKVLWHESYGWAYYIEAKIYTNSVGENESL